MKRFISGFIVLLSLSLSSLSLESFAQVDQIKEVQTFQKFGDYTVHYTVFGSKDIPAEVAKLYNITRADDISLVNISLTKTTSGKTSLGLPITLAGKTLNLMQQSQTLQFREINEGETAETKATYYIAPVRHNNEDDLRFEISIIPAGESKPLTISFSRRLYKN